MTSSVLSSAFSRLQRPFMKVGSALALGALLTGVPACNRTSGSGAAKDDLAIVPQEADVAFMVNMTQVRQSSMWKKLVEKINSDAKSKQQYDDFMKKCSFDPLNQIDSVFVAMPQTVAESKEYAVLVRGSFATDVVINCMKTTAKEKGETVTESDRNGTKIYALEGKQPSYLAAIGKKAIAFGGKEWIGRIVDLSAGKGSAPSAKDHKELVDLIKRTRTGDALWWAGLVPPAMVEKLGNNPQTAPVKSLKSVSGSIDPSKGLTLAAYLDLGSDADAAALTATATEQLTKARATPAIQMMGMSAYLDTIKVEAKKSTFVLNVNMTQQQVDDLTSRLSGMAKQFGM